MTRYFMIAAFTTALLIGIAPAVAKEDIWVHLEARPSKDCVPASSLQLPELKEDFAKVCQECRFVSGEELYDGYEIVVEDPGFNWLLTIYDPQGEVLSRFEWTGCLQKGLRKATTILRNRTQPN